MHYIERYEHSSQHDICKKGALSGVAHAEWLSQNGGELRELGMGAQILVDLGARRLRLMTNNPRKIVGLEGYGIEIVEHLSLNTSSH